MTPEPQWITTPHLRADHRGPVDRPYTPMVDPASAPPILEMLQSVARGQPDCVAIEEHDARLTYRELIDKVEQLRAAIERAQPVPGRVGILLPPSVDYAVALFAVLAAGRPSVLLDESHPETRNASIGAATCINLVLAARDRGWPDAVTLRVARDADPRPSAPLRAAPFGLDEPAFILCTSGSAGEPKPIIHSQRTMLHWARCTHDALHVRPDDRPLSLSSPASLGGFTGLVGFLLSGATAQMFDLRQHGLGGLSRR